MTAVFSGVQICGREFGDSVQGAKVTEVIRQTSHTSGGGRR